MVAKDRGLTVRNSMRAARRALNTHASRFAIGATPLTWNFTQRL